MTARGTTVALGRVAGLHGVRGWIKVFSYTDPQPAIFDYAPWTLEKSGQRTHFELGQARGHSNRLIAKLAGLDDRDAAALWVGATILTDRDNLPAPADDEFYWADLIGLTVVTTDGRELGQVERLIETGANDVLVVTGERERLIPWLRDRVIIGVDLGIGQIRVDWDPDI